MRMWKLRDFPEAWCYKLIRNVYCRQPRGDCETALRVRSPLSYNSGEEK